MRPVHASIHIAKLQPWRADVQLADKMRPCSTQQMLNDCFNLQDVAMVQMQDISIAVYTLLSCLRKAYGTVQHAFMHHMHA